MNDSPSQTRAPRLLCSLPLPHRSSRVVLCDVKPCQGYDWLEELLADQTNLMVVAGKVYRETPGALV